MQHKSWFQLIHNEIDSTGNLCQTSKILWIADENFDLNSEEIAALPSSTVVISNRFDVTERVIAANRVAIFNDFNLTKSNFDFVIYLVSKERLLTNYCIDLAVNQLASNGKLILAGKKQHGIKTYFNASKLKLGGQGRLKKIDDRYLALLSFPENRLRCLDDGEYHRIRMISECFGFLLFSKPGVYGWQKVDQGSELLATCVMEDLKVDLDRAASVLDLGCGSGYLTLLMASMGFIDITATDNNAAALAAIQCNLEKNQLSIKIVAGDCGQNIHHKFDYIICNPPFHQGYDHKRDLIDKFLGAAKNLLKNSGNAYFVVNAFIPIEAQAKHYFTKIQILANNTQFKVVKLTTY